MRRTGVFDVGFERSRDKPRLIVSSAANSRRESLCLRRRVGVGDDGSYAGGGRSRESSCTGNPLRADGSTGDRPSGVYDWPFAWAMSVGESGLGESSAGTRVEYHEMGLDPDALGE